MRSVSVFAYCVDLLTAHRSEPPCREMADSNDLILTPARKEEHHADAPEVKAPKLSKSQLRKQKKVQDEHTKRQQRAQVTHSCNEHSDACSMLWSNETHSCDNITQITGVRNSAAACIVRFATCSHDAGTHAWSIRKQEATAAPSIAPSAGRPCFARRLTAREGTPC